MMPLRSTAPAQTAPVTAVSVLNALLATTIDLQSQLKQAHWNVRGPGLTMLNAVFDRGATDVGRHADRLAERISSIGGIALGGIHVATEQSSLSPYPAQTRDVEQNVAAISAALMAYGVSARAGLDAIRALGDFATAEMLDGILRGVEQNLVWIARASQMERGDDPATLALSLVVAPPAEEASMRDRIEDWLNGSGGATSAYLTQR